jgi:hypothetical protein
MCSGLLNRCISQKDDTNRRVWSPASHDPAAGTVVRSCINVTYRDDNQCSSSRSSNRASLMIVVLVKSALAARNAG